MKPVKNLSQFKSHDVSPETEKRITEMPKVELHVHIEGATEPETYWQLAGQNKVSLNVNSLEEFRKFFEFRDFNHFTEVYIGSVRALQTAQDYYTIIKDFMGGQAEQNIVWTQGFLSLSLLQKMPRQQFLEAVKSALDDGYREHKVRLALIPDIARQFPETQDEVTDLVIDGFKQGIFIGLGLGGIERDFPPRLFVNSFDRARKQGVKLFAHAGETTGPETIRESLDLLKVRSIGHGIRVLDDAALVKRCAAEKIAFEVCPQSNYATGVSPKGKPHPLRKMVDAGLFCTVNSDDPAMFSSSLTQEYLLLASQGFTFNELWQLNLNGVKASVMPDEIRASVEIEFQRYSKSF